MKMYDKRFYTKW